MMSEETPNLASKYQTRQKVTDRYNDYIHCKVYNTGQDNKKKERLEWVESFSTRKWKFNQILKSRMARVINSISKKILGPEL
jgi:23S rRNA G2069 N7-methylase RlmK/C1962 C5-methylase RlmI